jgi:heme exporter protein CcmD
MADHAFYLAMSYAAAAVAILAELAALRVGRARALKRIEEERELETED